MPTTQINGVELYWELTGETGTPLVLVHDSWGDHHIWDFIAPLLARSFRVLAYDRYGGSPSQRPSGQDNIQAAVADLEALIEQLNLTPVDVLGNSFGALIVLHLANQRPDLLRSIVIHEPPLFCVVDNPAAEEPLKSVLAHIGVVIKHLEAGQIETGTRLFMETIAFGPDTWAQIPRLFRQNLVAQAAMFLNDHRTQGWLDIDLKQLATLAIPTLLTTGDQSPPFLLYIADKLRQACPQWQVQTLKGVGHIPHSSHPEKYAEIVTTFIQQPQFA